MNRTAATRIRKFSIGGALLGAAIGMLLIGCAEQSGTAGASPIPSSTHPLTNRVPSAEPTAIADSPSNATSGTAGPSATGAGEGQRARAIAIEACHMWQSSIHNDPDWQEHQTAASTKASDAAQRDAQYQPLASRMSELLSYIGKNDQASIDAGQKAFSAMSAECNRVGVLVNAA